MPRKSNVRMLVRGICFLAVVIVGGLLLAATSNVRADDPETCIQCDNDHNGIRDGCQDSTAHVSMIPTINTTQPSYAATSALDTDRTSYQLPMVCRRLFVR